MKSKIKNLGIALLSLAGLTSCQTANVTAPGQEIRQTVAVKNGQTTKELREDYFGGYGKGLLDAIKRDNGNTPKQWGMSRACARMVRKNKLIRYGVAQSKT